MAWMDLENRLRQFIGRTVQVAVPQGSGPIEGLLVSVTNASFTIQTAPPPGYGSPNLLTFFIQNISYVRILA
ncbi:MAG: hypothetical protein ACOYEF_12250 [Planifilum sp.]|jgi:hypothetical protein